MSVLERGDCTHVLLGGEGYCEDKVSCSRTQHNDPAQTLTPVSQWANFKVIQKLFSTIKTTVARKPASYLSRRLRQPTVVETRLKEDLRLKTQHHQAEKLKQKGAH